MRRKGFTLIEVLIAVAILALGIGGILALFPSTIQTASLAVEDTYASSIADSVVASLAAARREHQVFSALPTTAPNFPPTKYLLFDHDGVQDALVTPTPGFKAGQLRGSVYYAANYDADYVIVLPRAAAPNNAAAANEPVLLYPSCPAAKCPAGPPSNRSPAALMGAIADEFVFKPNYEGKPSVRVRRTYPCGRYRGGLAPPGFTAGDVRTEFLSPGAGPLGATRYLVDNYPQYSFAFALKRVAFHAPNYSSELYELRVMVFRNFDGSTATQTAIESGQPIPKGNVPVHEFLTQIDVGPKGDIAGGVPTINGSVLNAAPGQTGNPPPQPNGGDAGEADPADQY
jgi:prepilin-type N-terminal cleavage/methylation domain-containing protein